MLISMLTPTSYADLTIVVKALADHRGLFSSDVHSTATEALAIYAANMAKDSDPYFWLEHKARLEFVQDAMLAVQTSRHNPLNEDALRLISHMIMECSRFSEEV